MANETKYPALLSCERKLSPSDGLFFACKWENRADGTCVKLEIKEKSIRSTISNPVDLSAADSLKKITNPNLQRIDFCMLPNDMDTLRMDFTLKFFSGVTELSSCNSPEFAAHYADWVRIVLDDGTTVQELALRYAQNIADGRFFWRNRVGADALEIIVTTGDATYIFNGYDYSLKNFAEAKRTDNLCALAKRIEETLASPEPKHLILDVKAYAKIGEGQEVFPSQEMVHDVTVGREKDGKKSRFLYSTFGQAAMHSQKIGNAIRTIDTWYRDGEESLPIAAECYGAVTTKAIAYRNSRNDFYTLFKRALVTGKALSPTETMYVLSILLRGGVFGAKEG